MQLVSLESTWLSAILFNTVNTIGIVKNTLLSPGGEATMSLLLRLTALHSDTRPRRLDTVLNKLENSDFSLAIVPLESPLGN